VTDPEVRQRLVSETAQKFGGISILINNAGGGSQNRLIEDIDDQDLHNVVAFNLESAFAMCRLVVPHMKARKFGRIVNVASVAGRDAGRLSGPHYAAAKAGMIGMSRQLARDLGPEGITVNTVAPGIIETKRAMAKWDSYSAEDQQRFHDGIPVRRFGTPQEVAEAVMYFCSDQSGYTTGACLDVNGGSFRA
jgi:3-oxoacyl-[acyl-carrier protein] reductase